MLDLISIVVSQLHVDNNTHTHTHAHTGHCCLVSWQKGSVLSFQGDFLLLPPACHPSSLCPDSFAPSRCQQPYGYPALLQTPSCCFIPPVGVSLKALNAALSLQDQKHTVHKTLTSLSTKFSFINLS